MTQPAGSVPANELANHPGSSSGPLGSTSGIDSPLNLDGVMEHLGLQDATLKAADETEMDMSDETESEVPRFAAENPVLEQLEEVSLTLAGLQGEGDSGSESLDALSLLREALAAERVQLDAERQALEEARAALAQRAAELNQRPVTPSVPMTPAEASHAAALQILEQEIIRRTAELNQQRRAVDQERAALDEAQTNWRIEYKTQKETMEAELQKFSARQRMMRQEQAEWEKKSAEFNAERTRLREQKQSLQQQQAELAAERERVEMQAATILVGARVAEITVNERNEHAAEREAIQAERAEFARQRREVDELRATLERQQRELLQAQQDFAETQRVAGESHDEVLATLQSRVAEAEASLAAARRDAQSFAQQLEDQAAELTREREAFAEERRQWESSRTSAAPAPAMDTTSDERGDFDEQDGPAVPSEEKLALPEAAGGEIEHVAAGEAEHWPEPEEQGAATCDEQSAAVLHLMGVSADAPAGEAAADVPSMQSLGGSADRPHDEGSMAGVLSQDDETDLDSFDDSAIRLARLRAEAMGLTASPATPVQPVAIDESRESNAVGVGPWPLVPRVCVDKDEARQNLNSLRAVSQLSAHTAVAEHQSRTLRSSIAMRTLISLICFGGAAWFLSADLAGQELLWLAGNIFLVIGIYMAFDSFQKAMQLSVVSARRRHADSSARSLERQTETQRTQPSSQRTSPV